MISAQCDELRLMARLVRDYDYKEISRMLRRAADTIWELRNKLSGVVDQSERITELEDENARLRSCLSDDAENARQIMGENAKLRELCTDMHAWMSRALYEKSVRKHEYELMTERMDDFGVPHD